MITIVDNTIGSLGYVPIDFGKMEILTKTKIINILNDFGI
jgi:hypothetical protein